MNKTFRIISTVLFCIATVLVALNSNAVRVFVFHLWYGDHLTWNGIDVTLNDREYFLPTSMNSDTLFIGDWKSRDANIILHAGTRTREHQKLFLENFCRPKECSQVNEQSYTAASRQISSVAFIKNHAASNTATFHQYVVIDGGNAWIEFFGDETRYIDHKSTMDSLIEKIAHTEVSR